MNVTLFSIVMDVLIVVLLAGTIYYAYSLSKQLKIFRQSRSEFESLLMQLTSQINTAHDAIEQMQEAADTNGKVLNQLIRDGQLLSDEMQMVNDTSESLANRLERAASSGRSVDASVSAAAPNKSMDEAPVEKDDILPSNFAIRDREVEDNDVDQDIGFLNEEDDDEVGNFHSQAERELFTALKRKS